VVLMGIGTLAHSAMILARGGRGGDCPVAIIEDGFGDNQRVTVGTLDTIAFQAARRGVRSPAVVIAGDVVTLSPYAVGAFAAAQVSEPELMRNP
ncbi:MAG: uroporphyrinogen-III C-methyltransferase, partial [Brevibacterium sp.]|nr:uroporphyrinogen-III C-methyltransferase [Brevibacterium sp.]